ncbi:unnamed protein product [Caenorhabditis angaria]|uniref:Enoyl reductase (ER) domain-containing protein n=1 Tax=Caenorhabditis angaria TaxID=860376 RepID=A0A9P1I8F9_9PELO|nr:unnamed protein product [Caenorhabditis angaria]
MMRAALVRSFGKADVIEIVNDVQIPSLKPNQILVNNKAAGVNPVDTYIRSGLYAKLPQLPYTPGKDGAGIVKEIGSDVKNNLKIGDRVWYGMLTNGGSTAQFTAADVVFKLPDDVTFEQGAALGVPYMTAYRALFTLARAKTGDTILVHGASGGVGSAIVQFAKWKNIKVIGTAGTETGLEYVKQLGAENAYNHRKTGYIEEIKKNYPNGFNFIFEMAAHINLNNDLSLLSAGGKVAVIGNRAETTINARQLMAGETSIFGVALGLSTSEEYSEYGKEIGRFLSETKSRPSIAKAYKFEEISKAHTDILENQGAHGQIVVNIV